MWHEIRGHVIPVCPLCVRWSRPFYETLKLFNEENPTAIVQASGIVLLASGINPSVSLSATFEEVKELVDCQVAADREHNKIAAELLKLQSDNPKNTSEVPPAGKLVALFSKAWRTPFAHNSELHTFAQLLVLAIAVEQQIEKSDPDRPVTQAQARAKARGIKRYKLPKNWKQTMTPESYEKHLRGVMEDGLPKPGDRV